MSEPPSSWESAGVAGVLARRSREDLTDLLGELVSLLPDVMPGAQVHRSLLRRQVTEVRIPLTDTAYVLRRGAGGRYEASRQHQVRGVVIRTEPMEIDAFLAELGPAIDAELQRTERGRRALHDWLTSMDRS
ncbi:MAG: hypothetical protein KGL38_10180 [Gemmatimonadota bacterium]|nr:hypothetical protein [Gemmatimonadota bacterium]MDE3173282.1 hypothetical protein [Gemmatimonadota bacterium]